MTRARDSIRRGHPRTRRTRGRALVTAAALSMAVVGVLSSTAQATDGDTGEGAAPATGEVRHVTYPSARTSLAGGEHPLGVYLPPGWDPDRDEHYPLLVLSHGAGDDETAWFRDGRAAAILDGAIAEGVMPPAVVVTTRFQDLSDAPMGTTAFFDAYAAELRDSVIPFVQREFHAGLDRERRSFGGLSMGGAIGLHLLTEQPSLFSRYGIWSAAADMNALRVPTPSPEQQERMAQASAIHLGTGVDDRLGGIGARSQERAALFIELGLPVERHDIAGGHQWEVWRAQLDHYVRTVAFPASATVRPYRNWAWTAALVLGVVVTVAAVGGVRRMS